MKRPTSPLPKHKNIIPRVSFNELIGCKKGDYFLLVVGDSMTGDGIYDGDVVLMRPKVKVPNGAIAVVQVKNRGRTIKRVFFEEHELRLKASNPAYEDILVPKDEVEAVVLMKGEVQSNLAK